MLFAVLTVSPPLPSCSSRDGGLPASVLLAALVHGAQAERHRRAASPGLPLLEGARCLPVASARVRAQLYFLSQRFFAEAPHSLQLPGCKHTYLVLSFTTMRKYFRHSEVFTQTPLYLPPVFKRESVSDHLRPPGYPPRRASHPHSSAPHPESGVYHSHTHLYRSLPVPISPKLDLMYCFVWFKALYM